MEPERFAPVGEQVAVVVRYRARGRASGVEVDGRESALWTVKDGRAVRYEWFHEPDEALRAAGPANRVRPPGRKAVRPGSGHTALILVLSVRRVPCYETSAQITQT
jgi:hypothetical protein